MPDTTLISHLISKKDIEDANIIIVEDEEDTKQSTVESLKKNFNGDTKDPSNLLFYSSCKVNEIKQSVQRELSTKASQTDMDRLNKFMNSVIFSQSENEYKDIEILLARDGCETLKDRLDRDSMSSNSRALKKYKKISNGKRIFLGNFSGYGDILVNTSSSGTLVVRSANLFNIENMRDLNDFYMSYSDYGFTYTQKTLSDSKCLTIDIPIIDMPSGTYFFSANLFNDTAINGDGDSIQFKLPTTVNVTIIYSDKSSQQMNVDININNSNLFYFSFYANKTFRTIRFTFNEDDFIEGASLRFENIMVTGEELIESFIPYYMNTYSIYGKQYVYNVCLNNAEIHCEGYSTDIQVEYYNDDYSTEYIVDKLHALENKFYDELDYCGMIDNYGDYNFFTKENTESANESGIVEESKSNEYKRNGKRSLKVTYSDTNNNLYIISKLNNVPDNIKYISILLYIDKYITESMEQDAITVYLVADKTNIYPPNNYYKKVIDKDSILQGWSTIKMDFNTFEIYGSPNGKIDRIILEFSNNAILQGYQFYLNSVIFNQTMKPAILLSFNGIYDNTFEYTLPTLRSKGLDCTIFLNNSSTLSNTQIDNLIMYHLSGTDIGHFGCNPDKELLLEDNNYREQYAALKGIKEYIKNNFTYNPCSYSAPYGNLRPITSKIIRDFGYNIAKTNASTYCSFFGKKDICIPTIELNNEVNTETVIEKIRYAVSTGQTIGISTYNITEYGDEINAKRIEFEKVLKVIEELHDSNQAECMSYKSFYERCVIVNK